MCIYICIYIYIPIYVCTKPTQDMQVFSLEQIEMVDIEVPFKIRGILGDPRLASR